MTPQEFLQQQDIADNIPQLPTVGEYEQWLRANAEKLHLQDRNILQALHDYERSDLRGKLDHAREMWDYQK
jgi:hypothetical protein